MTTLGPVTDTDVLLTAVEAATLAPSVHNSQPWRFELHGDSVDLYVDRSRWLHEIDASGREMTISCGAALYFARLALRGLSREISIALLPDPKAADHLARVTMTGRRPATEDERDLIRAIPIRYTDRDRFENRPVPYSVIEELVNGVAREKAWLRPIVSSDDKVVTAVLLAHADDVQQTNRRYVDELIRWSRYDGAASDGIPRQAVSTTPVSERTSDFRLRDFDVDGRAHTTAGDETDEPPSAEYAFVCLLGTSNDNRRAWLEAGQALGDLLLRTAAHGVSSQPMTQVVEVPTTRVQLANALGLVGHPQVLLRLGYGTGGPTTHRRPVDNVVTLDD
jgi:hypothetical protein